MRRIIILAILLCLSLPIHAQEETQTPYELALQRIQEAEASGAKSLDLSGLGLTELPPKIANLSNLQLLYLQNNQLRTLPHSIGNLTNLQALYLENNQLSSLPAEVGELGNLRWLYLDNNQLSSLPAEISNMNSLCVLRLNNNQLQYLPSNISQLVNLRETECHLYLGTGNIYFADGIGFTDGISLDGNPLISPPQEVIEQGTPAILDYLENEAWWHLQRLIIAGATGFGIVVAFILGMRWRHRGKKKRA